MLPSGVFSNKYASELKLFKTPTQWFLLLVVLLVFFLLVPYIASPYWLTKLIIIGIHIIVLLGLHILVGLCGLASLGQAGFMAIGAFTVAILSSQWDINGWLCLPLSALAAGLVGLVVGLITVRLKLFYLAIATWVSQDIILWLLRFPGPKNSDNSWWDYTGGFTGIQLEPLTLGPFDFGSDTSLYILTVIFVIVGTYITLGIQRSNTGRILVAVRDNDLAAEVAGINLVRSKLLAFFIASCFAGVAGWLWAYFQLRVNASQFDIGDSIFYMGMIVIGGTGSISAVFSGVIFFDGMDIIVMDYVAPWAVDHMPSRWAAQIHFALKYIVGGLGVMMFIKMAPRGVAGFIEKFKLFYRLHPYSFRGS